MPVGDVQLDPRPVSLFLESDAGLERPPAPPSFSERLLWLRPRCPSCQSSAPLIGMHGQIPPKNRKLAISTAMSFKKHFISPFFLANEMTGS